MQDKVLKWILKLQSNTHWWTWNSLKNLSDKKCLWPDGFIVNFYKNFRKDLILAPLKLFNEIKRKKSSQNHFWKLELPWFQNQTVIQTKRELRTILFDEYICKNPQQNCGKHTATNPQKDHTHHDQEGFIPKMQKIDSTSAIQQVEYVA